MAIGAALLTVATACTEPSPPEPANAHATGGALPAPVQKTPAPPPVPASDPATPAASAEPEPAVPAAPPEPAALPLTRAQALEPDGNVVALTPGEEAVVDAGARFELEVGRTLRRARVVLLDAADAHVTCSTIREVGTTTVLELTPAPPLRPGSKYLLRVEGIDGGTIREADGLSYTSLAVPLIVAGTPPPPEPEKKPARRKRR